MVVPLTFDRLPRCVCSLVVAGPRFGILGELVPCHGGRFMTAVTCHFIGPGFNPLSMPACRTHGVRQREDSSEPFDHARLAAHDRPPLRGMIANLEEAPIDGHVVPVHVEHDDVARGDANDGIPGAAPQRVGAGGPDPRPALHLKARGRDHPVGDFHSL